MNNKVVKSTDINYFKEKLDYYIERERLTSEWEANFIKFYEKKLFDVEYKYLCKIETLNQQIDVLKKNRTN